MSWALRGVRSSTMAAVTRGWGALVWERHPNPRRLGAATGVRCFVFLEGKMVRNGVLQGLRTSRQFGATTAAVARKARSGSESVEYEKRKAVIEVAAAVVSRDVAQSVVVVESPSKAKTITKYLGSDYKVVPSYGHVRDLAARSGSVRPEDDFNMLWEVPNTARPHINSIKAALKGAQVLVLASDPDREGEAIAWHILEMLTMEGALPRNVQVKRVVFHEITKTAVTRALSSARDVSEPLVNAYLARRALDYLIGFSLSPVLWRKLPGSKSAGRVQSAALRLVCDREQEIEDFRRQEYWSVEAQLRRDGDGAAAAAAGTTIAARLTRWKGEKLGKFALANDVDAGAASKQVAEATLRVKHVKRRLVRRTPLAPYITSTLQQDASAKLGFGATRTMSIAQQLYEGVNLDGDEQTGLITYMRTDGVQISEDTMENIRSLAGSRYGEDHIPAAKRIYVSKVKNAQEAHEAIRPTDIFLLPSSLADVLEADALQLYTLIWARTVACQMETAVSKQVSVDVEDDCKNVQLRASSSTTTSPGFLAVYKDTAALGKFADKLQDDDDDKPTPGLDELKAGDSLLLSEVRPMQHFTEPLPRYSEGTLVKRLEELGIGRPSTYAPTLHTLQMRNYVKIEKRRIMPETRGRMVSAFLLHYFPDFTDFSFTANMERQLDEVSAGRADWKKVLGSFWPDFRGSVLDAMKVPLEKVVEMLEQALAKQFFPTSSSGLGDRVCPSCKEGIVRLKLSWYGSGYFFGCSRYPSCRFKANMVSEEDEECSDEDDPQTGASSWLSPPRPPKVLGVDPATQLQVVMRVGPYGAYVQLGEDSKRQKPRRTTIPKGVVVDEVTLEQALDFLSFPRELGKHPEEGTPLLLSIGRFGYFLRHRSVLASVPQGLGVEDLTVDKALEILNGKNVSRRGRKPRKVAVEEPIAELSSNESQSSSSPQNKEVEEQTPPLKPKKKHVKKTNAKTQKDKGAVDSLSLVSELDPVIPKRGRGRPKKSVATPSDEELFHVFTPLLVDLDQL